MDSYIMDKTFRSRRDLVFIDHFADIFGWIKIRTIECERDFLRAFHSVSYQFSLFLVTVLNRRYLLLFEYICKLMSNERSAPKMKIWLKSTWATTLNVTVTEPRGKYSDHEITVNEDVYLYMGGIWNRIMQDSRETYYTSILWTNEI